MRNVASLPVHSTWWLVVNRCAIMNGYGPMGYQEILWCTCMVEYSVERPVSQASGRVVIATYQGVGQPRRRASGVELPGWEVVKG